LQNLHPKKKAIAKFFQSKEIGRKFERPLLGACFLGHFFLKAVGRELIRQADVVGEQGTFVLQSLTKFAGDENF
jgi:hypothetical protein